MGCQKAKKALESHELSCGCTKACSFTRIQVPLARHLASTWQGVPRSLRKEAAMCSPAAECVFGVLNVRQAVCHEAPRIDLAAQGNTASIGFRLAVMR